MSAPNQSRAEAPSGVTSISHFEVTPDAVDAYLEATLGVACWSAVTHGASPVPPLFAALVGQDAVWEAVSAFVAHRPGTVGLLQYEHDMRFVRPLRLGDRVVSRAAVEPGREGRRGLLARLGVTTRRDDSVVSEMEAGLLVMDEAAIGRVTERAGHGRGKALRLPDGRSPDLSRRFHIGVEHIERYSEVSGDRNPVHLDARVATALGLPGVIAQGVLILSCALHAGVDAYADGDPTRIRRVRARLASPVFPDETVTTAYEWTGPRTLSLRARTDRAVVLKGGTITLGS